MNVKDELLNIYREHDRLTPQLVVEVATDPAHPLHDRLEWDDTKAGHQYRIHQARELIRVVKVTEVSGQGLSQVRAFVSVQREDGPSYTPIEDVRGDEITTALVLRTAEREWRQLYERYQDLSGFLSVVRRDVAS